MDSDLLLSVIAIATVGSYLLFHFHMSGTPFDNWDEVGYYKTRNLEHISRIERRFLPYITGVPNIVPLYYHRRAETWAYRIRNGPWISPTPEDIHQYACDENGDPLF